MSGNGAQASDFVVCIDNDGYPASLEIMKIYRLLPDAKAQGHRMVRVVDESGEDYLYPQERFVAIDLPQRVAQAFSTIAPNAHRAAG